MTEEPSDLELLQEIDELAEKLRRTPTKAVIHGQGTYDPKLYVERFGSWEDALVAAGVDPTQESRRMEAEFIFDQDTIDTVEELLDKNEGDAFLQGQLLAELMRLRIDLEYTPSVQEMEQFGKYSSSIYASQFGSWNNAIRELDLDLNKHLHKDVTDTDMLDELRRLKNELGEAPTVDDMNNQGKYSVPMYYTRFESWEKALKLAGFEQPTYKQ